MLESFKNLCMLNGVSGNEDAVREYILSEIAPYCECYVDSSGNIIANKKGKKTSEKKILIDAHMDEVGLIITGITNEGFLKFQTVGGINDCVLASKKVTIGNTVGVICSKPVHLCSGEEKKKYTPSKNLYIDIGALSLSDAQKKVSVGDYAAFKSEFRIDDGGCVSAKAIDDRAGCAILVDLIKKETEYDFTASFTVCEEVGLRGAKTAAYTVSPDFAIVLEATTAADIYGSTPDNAVTYLKKGPAVSFMDKASAYDKQMFNAALNSGIECQVKSAVAGGNNAGAIHLSKSGVRTLAISVPCRYIHSALSKANIADIENAEKLAEYMLNTIGSGTLDD